MSVDPKPHQIDPGSNLRDNTHPCALTKPQAGEMDSVEAYPPRAAALPGIHQHAAPDVPEHRQQQTGSTQEQTDMPEFMQQVGYPHTAEEMRHRDPIDGHWDHSLELAEDTRDTGQNLTTATPDTEKWPFPTHTMEKGTALIYDTVKASGCHNHQGARITLPMALNIEAWKQEVTRHPDDETVIQGIQFGFPIQYGGPPQYAATSTPNHASARNFNRHVQKYIKEELQHGAMEGPYDCPPFTPWCVTSPLMSREKSDSDSRRIIVDLSFPDGGVNAHITPHVFNGRPATHNLPTIETAVGTITAMCPGQVTMAVIDLSRAYRQFPVSPLDLPLLAIKVDKQHYFDRRLPFGARMSSFTMQMIADFIIRALAKKKIKAHMYLDDIVIISSTPALADSHYAQNTRLLRDLGLQLADKKVQPPSQQVRWLGIDFDVQANLLAIPQDKLQEIQRCMAAAAKKDVLTRKQLQRVVGLANHLAKVVRAARTFIGRILAAYRAAQGNDIPVSRQVKADLSWFARHLASSNGRAIIPTNTVVKRIWADACMEGAGASDEISYYTHKFPPHVTEKHHIAQLEALNCVAATRAFVNHTHAGGTVAIHCDNKPSIDAFRSGRAKDPILAACTRALWYKAAETDVSFTFTHVPGGTKG